MGTVSVPVSRAAMIVFATIVLVVVLYVFARTDFGLKVQATIRDRQMASAVGINTSHIDQAVFAFGAGLAGLAGAVMSPVIAINPNMGLDYFAQTFLVVILGGAGRILGVLGGGATIGMTQAGLSAVLKPVVAQALVLVVTIGLIRLYPQGLFGRRR